MLLVLDTNVFVSGSRGKDTAPSLIYTAWKHGQLDLAFSPQMIEELRRVLTYPRVQKLLGASVERIQAELAGIADVAWMTPGVVVVDRITQDPSDNMILACALEARADTIVSGDSKHLLPLKSFEGIPIVSPKEFVRRFQQALPKAA
jgi:hypothetical protein